MTPDEQPAPRDVPSLDLVTALGSLKAAGLDDLLREVLLRVDRVIEDQRRLRLLLDAVLTIAADLDLDSVLSRIVEVAAELAEAEYVALGVLGAGPERRLRAFITHGISDEGRTSIGDLPSGHGILGLIIDQPRPLRLHDIVAHPASYGFPANHPPMHSFLGVPVRIGDRIFGNLYLTEKRGKRDFTAQDEAIVVALAAAAGVVVENARLYEESVRREQWLEATAELNALLGDDLGAEQALEELVSRAQAISGADVATVLVRGDGAAMDMHATSGLPPGVEDRKIPEGSSLVGLALDRGEAIVSEDLREDPRAAPLPDDWPVLGPLLAVPLQAGGRTEGVLVLAWSPDRLSSFREVDPRLPARYAEQAALALQVARGRRDQERLAVFEDRDRIGRDLHDLVIQRLFAVGLSLENASRMSDQPEVRTRVGSAVDDIDETIKEIRRTIFALSVEKQSPDLRRAIYDVAERAERVLGFRPVVALEGPVDAGVPPAVAPHLLAVLGEALTNVARHAEATEVRVRVSTGQDVVLTVRDDGRGLPEHVKEGGLRNLRERAQSLGGDCSITSSVVGGTVLTWAVPRG